jgi:SagB-type dehydrogenase family enzyme
MQGRSYDEVVRYHERTKHHFNRFAPSLGYMDWDNQPDPFRSYEGASPFRMPLLTKDPEAHYADLYRRDNNEVRPFVLENVAAFMELAMGLSAWKAVSGSQWSLRINPSSGNLHPTESHLILPAMDSLPGGVFHYNPFHHSLERRAVVSGELWRSVIRHFGTEGLLVALTSIFWREAWKYGERGFRYCNHDLGHALACLSISANLQGWKVKILNALSDDEIERTLGFHKVRWEDGEEEQPEVLCFVCGSQVENVPRGLPPEIVSGFSDLPFTGRPNVLSAKRVPWEAISQVAARTRKPATPEIRYHYTQGAFIEPAVTPRMNMAADIIRKRRSAVSFTRSGFLTQDRFFAILQGTLPLNNRPPFDVELIRPSVHLLLFVHSVQGLDQGLYFFLRDESCVDKIKSASSATLSWRRVRGDLPLFFLREGNFRSTAARVSCDQDIAGDSIFSLGMIARFSDTIQEAPYTYRHLFWESGMIGQTLYLEAEAHGVRGTGIGCFYDDPVHDVMGFRDNSFQSLYHFTIGEPVEDRRLATYPPYSHLKKT